MPSGFKLAAVVLSSLGLGACATLPAGPSMLVLPGLGKSFEQFRSDDFYCRQFAYGQIGGMAPSQVATANAAGSALLSTAIGAAIGAAFAGGEGAAVGAGAGLLFGSLAGADSAYGSDYYVQERYDMSYVQCMYAQGHRVPVSGQFTNTYTPNSPSQPNIPPPPSGYPPPMR